MVPLFKVGQEQSLWGSGMWVETQGMQKTRLWKDREASSLRKASIKCKVSGVKTRLPETKIKPSGLKQTDQEELGVEEK